MDLFLNLRIWIIYVKNLKNEFIVRNFAFTDFLVFFVGCSVIGFDHQLIGERGSGYIKSLITGWKTGFSSDIHSLDSPSLNHSSKKGASDVARMESELSRRGVAPWDSRNCFQENWWKLKTFKLLFKSIQFASMDLCLWGGCRDGSEETDSALANSRNSGFG